MPSATSPTPDPANSHFSTPGEPAPAAPPSDRQLTKILAAYRNPDPRRSLLELLVTAVPFFLLWAIMLICLDYGYWLSLLLAVPAAGFLVRLFLIQHDCGHGSFFRLRQANHLLGRAISVLTLTPYDYWRRTHAIHHATSGNLDRRGTGDIDTLTVAEFLDLPRWRRLAYRLSRHPLILLVLGPAYIFLLKYRVPVELIAGDKMAGGKEIWISTMTTNLAIVGAVVGMSALVGVQNFLLVQLPITLLASSIGVWLFYVQHQFEHTYWADEGDWNFHTAAMRGCSHLDLPAPLRWFTANIGVHHIHHLASRIPSYRLSEVLDDHPQLRNISRLTLRQSFELFRCALWDEDRQGMVAFRDIRHLTSPGKTTSSY